MARRRPRQKDQKNQTGIIGYLKERRSALRKVLWVLIGIVSILFGYSNGYPLVAQGQLWQGILIGVAYGAGAFIVILAAFILNQRLKGS